MNEDKFISSKLDELLVDPKYSDKSDLILFVKNGSDIKAKCQLFTLLAELNIDSITIDNLRKKIKHMFCSNSSVETYLSKIVCFNPILSYISISSSSGLDLEHDYSLDIIIPVPFDPNIDVYQETANKMMKDIKDVLTIILFESKTIC